MSATTAQAIREVLRALSPLRILLVLWREFFASSGPGRKLARDGLAVYCYLVALPTLAPHPDALVYATILVFTVLAGGQIAQGFVGDKLKAWGASTPPPPAGGSSP